MVANKNFYQEIVNFNMFYLGLHTCKQGNIYTYCYKVLPLKRIKSVRTTIAGAYVKLSKHTL